MKMGKNQDKVKVKKRKAVTVDPSPANPAKDKDAKILKKLVVESQAIKRSKKLKSKTATTNRKREIDKKRKAQTQDQEEEDEDPFDVPPFEEIEVPAPDFVHSAPESDSDDSVEVVDLLSDEYEDEESSSLAVSDFMEPFEYGIWYRKLNSTRLLVYLQHEASLTFTGKARLHVLHGSIEIYGHKLPANSKPCEVYCPQPSPVLSIRTDSDLHLTDEDSGSKSDLLQFVEQVIKKPQLRQLQSEDGGALLVMEGFESQWSLGFRNLLGKQARHVIGEKMTDQEDDADADTFDSLGFTLYSQPAEDTELQEEISSRWAELFQNVSDTADAEGLPKIGVFGGQNSGKSTLTTWFTNQFLNYKKPVLYIDLDPGQPEFTHPGMISAVICECPVFGPNYTHLAQPILSVFLGSTNVSDTPVSYWNAVKQLWNSICKNVELGNMPWIVNTMGFARGLGVDLTCEIIRLFQLNAVVQLNLKREKSDYPFDLMPRDVTKHKSNFVSDGDKRPLLDYKFYKIDSVHCVDFEGQSEATISGPDRKLQREYAILSYFANTLPNGVCGLESVVPYMVPLKSIKIGLESLNTPPPPFESILRAINANLIALCHCSSSSGDVIDSSDQSEPVSVSGMLDYKNATDISCIGYGFVRAIDLQKETAFVITPIPADTLRQRVNCIIPAGNIGVPTQFYGHATGAREGEAPYIMNPRKHRINSRLHSATKKFFVPNRVAAHNLLRKCLL